MDKKNGILIVGIITFIALIFLSIFYYKERILFADPGFQLSYMIKDGGFSIQVYRYVAILSKIFPFIAIKLSLPLNTIILLYSMSFGIYNFIFFLFIILYLKSQKWALILLLFNILMVSQSFYWPAIELNQGIAVMILYFAFLEFHKETINIKVFTWIITIFLIVTIVFSHPLTIIPFLFISIYLFLFYKKYTSIKLLAWSGIFTIATLILKSVFFRNWYDDKQMNNLNNFIDLFPNYFNIQSNKDFLQYLINDYYITGILFILLIVYLIKQSDFLKFGLIISFVFGYLFLVNISFPNGGPNFFVESKYILLSLFVSIPIIFNIYPKIAIRPVFITIAVIIFIRLIHIYNTHDLYTARLGWLRNTLDKTEGFQNKKLIISEDEVPMDTLLMSWGTSYEFLLLSTIENRNPRSIIVSDNPDKFDSLLNKANIFLEEYRVYNYKQFPERYFHFDDSTGYVRYHLK